MFVIDEKLTSRVFRLQSHKMHKQRLNDIKAKGSTRINNSVPRTLKYQQIKRSGYVNQEKERKSTIQKENEKIFKIITEISSGKRASTVQFIMDQAKSLPQPKSLNLTTRKIEAQRIIDDNEALAKRLFDCNKGVSFEKFDEDWQNVTKYLTSISKKNIRKLPKLEDLSKYMPTLMSPQLDSKKTISTKSTVSKNHKRNLSVFSPSVTSPMPGSKLEEIQEFVREEKNKSNRSLSQDPGLKGHVSMSVDRGRESRYEEEDGKAEEKGQEVDSIKKVERMIDEKIEMRGRKREEVEINEVVDEGKKDDEVGKGESRENGEFDKPVEEKEVNSEREVEGKMDYKENVEGNIDVKENSESDKEKPLPID